MHPMGDMRTHFLRMMEMSKTLGVDLGKAMREGNMSESGYADSITRCRGCDQPDGCRSWLNQTVSAVAAPEYCRNGSVFADLASAKPAH